MIAALLVGCLGGASFAEEDIAATYADMWCRRLKECARGDYDAIYFGAADCRRQNEVVYDALVASFEECEYHEDEAEEAYDRLGHLSCGDFHDGAYVSDYAEIWTGCPAGAGPVDTGAP
jgi:hypothetical protein